MKDRRGKTKKGEERLQKRKELANGMKMKVQGNPEKQINKQKMMAS
jgi:hypothetical protein